MKNYYKTLNGFKPNHLVFDDMPPEKNISPQSEDKQISATEHEAERVKTTKEILEGIQQDRTALAHEQATDLTLETKESDGDKLLKADTYILISRRGAGSKHNTAGWKGLALATDSVKVLNPRVKLIGGVEMVKVKLTHKLYSKPGAKERFRTYTGYIEKSQFKSSEQFTALAKEPKTPESKENVLINAQLKFKQLFEKYKLPGKQTKITTELNRTNIWTINYEKHDLVTRGGTVLQVTIFSENEPFRYLVGRETKNTLDDALKSAESILEKEIGTVSSPSAPPTLKPTELREDPREIELRDAQTKFIKLFKEYNRIPGISTNITKKTNPDRTWTISFEKNPWTPDNATIVEVTVDPTKEPIEYSVNQNPATGLEDALISTNTILHKEIGQKPLTP